MRRSLPAVLSAIPLLAAQSWAPEDLWDWRAPSEARISPDSRQVVYVENWNDRAANAACSNLWLVSTKDRQSHRLTDGPWRDRSPCWSPDSARIAWISGRGGIHVLDLSTGQERAIDASSPIAIAWSADSRSIAFTAIVASPAAPPAWAPPAVLPWLQIQTVSHTGLFAVSASAGSSQPLTDSYFEPAGTPAWMPDSKSILTAASDGELYSVRLAGGSPVRLVTETGNPGDLLRKESPLPSPNGARIAWMATDAHPHSYSVRKLYVMSADGTHLKQLANGLDRDPSDLQWSSDSRTIYFLADDAGSTHAYASRFDSTLRQATQAVETLNSFSLADNGTAAAIRDAGRGAEVITFPADLPPPTPAVVAAPMEKQRTAHGLSAVEELHVPFTDRTVQAWILKPPQFDPARQYPLLLDVADAPRRMFSAAFDLRSQIVAAQGWLVLHVNPRGTPGYGEYFGRLLPTRFPGDDADDLLATLDFVVAKGYADPHRLAISGGLLAAWIVGHTDRFAAATTRHPIVDLALYAAGSPANARDALSWMGVPPWEDPLQYARHSPIYFAQNWKTPTLVVAEPFDSQADELYSELQQRKVPSVMLRVPDDKPATAVLELQAMLAWLRSPQP